MNRLVFLSVLLLCAVVQISYTQISTISGRVTAEIDSLVLEGVTIQVKGTTYTSTTDIEGFFTLSIPGNINALVFRYPGMKTKEVNISGLSVIDVILKPDIPGVEKEFETALGIMRTDKTLGYSIQEVKSEAISRAATDDFINAMNGKLAGVQIISTSGMPGASVYMKIRGPATLLGNNQPLFVVDGMPIVSGRGEMATTNRNPNPLGGTGSSSRSIDLNPEDIASLTLLKPGSATALYGVRAANGVVMISTKQGTTSPGRMGIDFHTSMGIDRVSNLPPRQNKFVQGNNGEWISGFQRSWGPNADIMEYDTRSDPDYKWDINGRIVPEDHPNANGIPVKMYDTYDFFKTGLIFNNRLSLTSGNDHTNFYFSIANLEHSGVIENSCFGRTNVRLNASSVLTRWFRIGTNMAYSNSRANQLQQGSNMSGVMLGLLRTPPSFDNAQGYEFPDGTQRNFRHGSGYDNPYWTVNKNYLDEKVNRFIGNTLLYFTFTDWLSASYNIGLDTYTRQRKDVIAINSSARPEGAVEAASLVSKQLNSDLMLNFHRTFGNLNAGATLGYNMFQSGWEDLFGDAEGLEIPDFYTLSNSADNQTGIDKMKYRTAALFFVMELSYADMLFLGISGRNEWSTTLPEANNSAFYPSFSLGFVFTELPDIRANPVLTFGKLRGSWARIANMASPYHTTNYYNSSTTRDGWTNGVASPWQGTNGLDVRTALGNQELGHETMNSFEVGADLRFFRNRLGVDFSYFRNLSSDLLLWAPVINSLGYGNIFMNSGEMENRGYELILTARVLTGSLGWEISSNLTTYTNTVLSLAPGVGSIAINEWTIPQSRAVAGEEYGIIYGNDWFRDENAGTPTFGQILINDDPNDAYRDGYPMTDTRRMKPVGEVLPDWTAGIMNTLQWKGIGLSFLFDIKKGGWMYNGTGFAMNFFGVHERTVNREVFYRSDGQIEFEKTPGKNLVKFVGVYGNLNADGSPNSSGIRNDTPVVLDEEWFEGFGSNFGGGAETAAMERTDWLRLRELTLSYDIPTQKKIISIAEVYFSGRNLWLKTPYSGIDPETNLEGAVNGQGLDYFNMPGVRTYTLGVKLSF